MYCIVCISSLTIMLIIMSSKKTFCTILFSMCLLFHRSKSGDTITSTNFLSDAKNESLVSSDGNFRLGFFSPRNSFNRYVGIWFNKISEQNVVWVANRDRPLKEKDGIFKIITDGNIVVYSGANESEHLWSSNISLAIITANSTAKLFSSGNLVLTAANAMDRNKIDLWQSFDHPTNTALVGMKFGLDKRNGLRRALTSWKSEEDPAIGEYSAMVVVDGPPQFFVYKKSSPIWRAGPWNGQSLSGVPTVSSRLKTYQMIYTNESSLFSSTYVNNNDEVCVIFDSPGQGIFKMLQLDTTGIAREQLWHAGRSGGTSSHEEARSWVTFWANEQDQCDHYMHCGPSTICNTFNSPTECSCLPGYEPESPGDYTKLKCIEKRKELHNCGKGIGEGFLKLPGSKLPDAKFASFFGNLSLQDCEKVCIKSCNCTAYASADVNVGGRGCYAWFGELNDVKRYHSEDGQDFYIRLDAVELGASRMPKIKKSHKKRRLIIIIAVLGPVAFMLFFCYLYRWRSIKKHAEESERFRNLSHINLSGSQKLGNNNTELTFFSLDTILTSTANFSSANKLGQGGFGSVYKGQLSNGLDIAVKRLSNNSGHGISEFKNEASLIAKLQHKNLVRLVGCCIEDEEKMLIYEYMSNKSLDYFIFDNTKKSLLDWPKRHQIFVGVARGIMYLHQDSRLKVIHRDLKASNILLDNEMNPKISDFGTARIFGGNQSQANTCQIVGTYGYMSPEYGLYGFYSEKSDVFSFGVLLLEIISGRKNTELFEDSSASNLLTYTWEHWKNGRAENILDTSIRDDSFSTSSEVVRCIQLGLLCVQDDVTDRPTMSDVVYMLSDTSDLPKPKQPVFAVVRSIKEWNEMVPDLNEVTITEPSGR